MSERAAWRRSKLGNGTCVYEADGFRIERDWVWSDRLGRPVPADWVAYQGRGPTRNYLGTFDTLNAAKARCLEMREEKA